MTLEEKLEKKDTEWLRNRYKEIVPIRDEALKISFILSKRRKDVSRLEKYERLLEIKKKTGYRDAELPDIGIRAINGTCVLNTEDDATELSSALNDASSYYFSYSLKWQGAGRYSIIPSYTYDHDNDLIYTMNFEKRIK